MSQRTTSSSWASTIVRSLEMGGVDCRSLFERLGMDYSALSDPEARFPQDCMTGLWHLAVEASGNPVIALNMAQVVRPSSFHVVGYALMSSRNLHEGISSLVRYQRIIGESADLSFHPTSDGYELTLAIHGDRLPSARESAEGSLAYILAFCRWLACRPLTPRLVSFSGPAPANLKPYCEVFQAPLKFNAEHYALLFDRTDLDAPLHSANEALAHLHERFAGEYLARFSDGQITHQVRQLLCRLLPQGEPKREVVAQTILMSERTLQRRLQAEGTGFHQLLDGTRRELASQYLVQPNLTLQEISYLLGFAAPSNFFRAFRRWFNTTPNEYRAGL
ncbi:AraC family transcriptional regulator [Pseudomonas fluorescens]|uniref:AraC family transcriptional regulator n=1 Tax=Pseudomonas fluorescens TaxID=294 RepID=A0A0F4TYF5_PSEFL|nr:AraC family transcriptional regulator [Pseudomonas fluorescens]KJZ49448.1 AraC family transcriptional regulator [Pseudomonas fluorescens]